MSGQAPLVVWVAVFVGDSQNNAWALVDSDGNEREPSFWYNSREEAEKYAGGQR